MEKKTMGAFLSALRKANGYTQQEVADRLNVSNKTISNHYSLFLGFIPIVSDFELRLTLSSIGLALDIIIIAAVYFYCRKKKAA